MSADANGAQYLEDLATSYWKSEVLFSALELDIFEHLQEPVTLQDVCGFYSCNSNFMKRFLDTLVSFDLLTERNGQYQNSTIAEMYLKKDAECYQGDSILWRKELKKEWESLTQTILKGRRIHYIPEDDEDELLNRNRKYISAMDAVVKEKAQKIVSMFKGVNLNGRILDVGAGSGGFSIAFLKAFPHMTTTLLDLENVITLDRERYGHLKSVAYDVGNILEEWTVKGEYDILILSNILHAYSETEVVHILDESVQHLSHKGYMVIHDFFLEHNPVKARLSDLNMMINTYNGKVFSGQWVCEYLESTGLHTSGLVHLKGDTGVIFASKTRESLGSLCINET